MKAAILGWWMAAGVSVAGLAANPTDRAILAAMQLGEAANYTWSTAVTDDARTYGIEGRTERGGFTWMRLPMVLALARRLGREAEVDIEAIFQGNAHCVVRVGGGWLLPAELPKPRRDWHDEYFVIPTSRGTRAGWIDEEDPLLEPRDVPPALLAQWSAASDGGNATPYSNAQFALALPHEELGVVVSSYAELAIKGPVVTGRLTDLGAQLLLVREGQAHITPVWATGSFRLQISNGVVTQYRLRLEGLLLVDGKRVRVRQASTTTIRDIGRTQLLVPEEALGKLAGWVGN